MDTRIHDKNRKKSLLIKYFSFLVGLIIFIAVLSGYCINWSQHGALTPFRMVQIFAFSIGASWVTMVFLAIILRYIFNVKD